MELSKETRQQILEKHALKHNGRYDPKVFFKEVSDDRNHPARSWFEWDERKAALEHNFLRARQFVQGLKIPQEVHFVERKIAKIKTVEVPAALSPMSGRKGGGGYNLTSYPQDIPELCRQAARALDSWCNRYEAAVIQSGNSVDALRRLVLDLEKASTLKEVA